MTFTYNEHTTRFEVYFFIHIINHNTNSYNNDDHDYMNKLFVVFSAYVFSLFQVKAQYNILMDGIKQTSFPNLQGDLDSHMETLNGQVRAHQAQQALSLHKVDMEASVMEVNQERKRVSLHKRISHCV